jgi:2-hydroxychromene-2-carboxylate isomerase
MTASEEQKRADLSARETLRYPETPLVALDLRSVETYLLAQPLTWLARESEGALWCPLPSEPAPLDLDRAAAKRAADRLELPLAWPERHPATVPKAMRVAALACAGGWGAAYVFGMSRLAFGGAGDLEDLEEYLLGIEETDVTAREAALAATEGSGWEAELGRLASELRSLGIMRAPALRWEGRLYLGTREIAPVLARSANSQPPLDLA